MDYKKLLKADPRVGGLAWDGDRHWINLKADWCYPISDPDAGWGFGNQSFDSWKEAYEDGLTGIYPGTHC